MTNTPQVKIKTAIVETFTSLDKYKKELFKALLIPMVLFMVMESILLKDLNASIYAFVFIVGVALEVRIAITTHRVLLLGPQSVATWGISKWTSRETMFLFYLLLLYGSVFATVYSLELTIRFEHIFYAYFFAIIFAYFTLLFIVLWLICRLSLIFPAIAVGKSLSLKHSWELTRGRNLFVLRILLLIPLCFYIPILVLEEYFPEILILTNFLYALAIVAEIALLSFAYKLIAEQ